MRQVNFHLEAFSADKSPASRSDTEVYPSAVVSIKGKCDLISGGSKLKKEIYQKRIQIFSLQETVRFIPCTSTILTTSTHDHSRNIPLTIDNSNSDHSCLHMERYAEVSRSMPAMLAITISYANSLETILIDFTILDMLIALLYTVNILGLTDCVILILDPNLPGKVFAFVLRSVRFLWLARLVRLHLGSIGVILMF